MSPEEKALYDARHAAREVHREAETAAMLLVKGSDGNPRHFRVLEAALGKAIAAEQAYWEAEEAILRFDHPDTYGTKVSP